MAIIRLFFMLLYKGGGAIREIVKSRLVGGNCAISANDGALVFPDYPLLKLP